VGEGGVIHHPHLSGHQTHSGGAEGAAEVAGVGGFNEQVVREAPDLCSAQAAGELKAQGVGYAQGGVVAGELRDGVTPEAY